MIESSAISMMIAGFTLTIPSVLAEPASIFHSPIPNTNVIGDKSKEDASEIAAAEEVKRIDSLLNTREGFASKFGERLWTNAGEFEATAYCLRGRTASGEMTRRGVVAADPRVLRMGTVVHLQAGPYTGIYTVLDTGSLVKGKRVDIYCASRAEAIKFGRRTVRVSVVVPARYADRAVRKDTFESR